MPTSSAMLVYALPLNHLRLLRLELRQVFFPPGDDAVGYRMSAVRNPTRQLAQRRVGSRSKENYPAVRKHHCNCINEQRPTVEGTMSAKCGTECGAEMRNARRFLQTLAGHVPSWGTKATPRCATTRRASRLQLRLGARGALPLGCRHGHGAESWTTAGRFRDIAGFVTGFVTSPTALRAASSRFAGAGASSFASTRAP